MRLPELSVRRSISMIMLFIALIGFGIFSLSQLGLDLFPKLEFPQIVIVSMMRGAGPEEMERLVTDVLEEATSRLKTSRILNQPPVQEAVLFSPSLNGELT